MMRRFKAYAVGVATALFKRSLWVAGVLLCGIFAVQLYWTLLPGSWFLTSSDVRVASSTAGRDVPFDWCRQPRHGAIDAQAVRSFSKKGEDGKFHPVSQYHFAATIEPIDEDCQSLSIMAKRQPQEEGTYYFVTDLTWLENGHEKKLRYRSNSYFIASTPDSLRQRIKELESEVKQLRTRLSAFQRGGQQAVVYAPAPTTPTTTASSEPTTSAPPDPDSASPTPNQERPGLIRRIVNPLVDPVLEVLERTQ